MHKQHAGAAKIQKCDISTGSIPNSNSGDNPTAIDNKESKIN